jgi:hypothetical protein
MSAKSLKSLLDDSVSGGIGLAPAVKAEPDRNFPRYAATEHEGDPIVIDLYTSEIIRVCSSWEQAEAVAEEGNMAWMDDGIELQRNSNGKSAIRHGCKIVAVSQPDGSKLYQIILPDREVYAEYDDLAQAQDGLEHAREYFGFYVTYNAGSFESGPTWDVMSGEGYVWASFPTREEAEAWAQQHDDRDRIVMEEKDYKDFLSWMFPTTPDDDFSLNPADYYRHPQSWAGEQNPLPLQAMESFDYHGRQNTIYSVRTSRGKLIVDGIPGSIVDQVVDLLTQEYQNYLQEHPELGGQPEYENYYSRAEREAREQGRPNPSRSSNPRHVKANEDGGTYQLVGWQDEVIATFGTEEEAIAARNEWWKTNNLKLAEGPEVVVTLFAGGVDQGTYFDNDPDLQAEFDAIEDSATLYVKPVYRVIDSDGSEYDTLETEAEAAAYVANYFSENGPETDEQPAWNIVMADGSVMDGPYETKEEAEEALEKQNDPDYYDFIVSKSSRNSMRLKALRLVTKAKEVVEETVDDDIWIVNDFDGNEIGVYKTEEEAEAAATAYVASSGYKVRKRDNENIHIVINGDIGNTYDGDDEADAQTEYDDLMAASQLETEVLYRVVDSDGAEHDTFETEEEANAYVATYFEENKPSIKIEPAWYVDLNGETIDGPLEEESEAIDAAESYNDITSIIEESTEERTVYTVYDENDNELFSSPNRPLRMRTSRRRSPRHSPRAWSRPANSQTLRLGPRSRPTIRLARTTRSPFAGLSRRWLAVSTATFSVSWFARLQELLEAG